MTTPPHLDHEALEQGYLDGLATEETLGAFLDQAKLAPWSQAQRVLPLRYIPRPEKYVALLPLTGLILEGKSGRGPGGFPLVSDDRLGSLSVVQQIRNLMQNEHAAAVVLWIDSRGGSASASEAIASALAELARTRPVVAYMNGVAASGGYYIATPAHWIVAQPGTITGSIGVIAAKAINTDMLRKLRFNAFDFQRGANADFFAPNSPFNEAQRQRMRQIIERSYDQFLGRVAASRGKAPEELEPLAGGRVWTGALAAEHHLVDELGGLEAALRKARALANLPDDTPFGIIRGKGKPLAPQLAEQANPAAQWRYLQHNLAQLLDGRAQMIMPFVVD
ncbi:MAG: signal peptide peptidase SppA [Anaerolineae bacterium]|nr:signal peptide peptidase SppA [Anaerolineae bacterium]